ARDTIDLIVRAQHRIDEILDEQDIAYLAAVTVERQRRLFQRLDHEVRDPALILGALRAAVGTMKIERLSLGNARLRDLGFFRLVALIARAQRQRVEMSVD